MGFRSLSRDFRMLSLYWLRFGVGSLRLLAFAACWPFLDGCWCLIEAGAVCCWMVVGC